MQYGIKVRWLGILKVYSIKDSSGINYSCETKKDTVQYFFKKILYSRFLWLESFM